MGSPLARTRLAATAILAAALSASALTGAGLDPQEGSRRAGSPAPSAGGAPPTIVRDEVGLRLVDARGDTLATVPARPQEGMFGYGAAILARPGGSLLAVAAPIADGVGPRSGRVWVFTLPHAPGERPATLTPRDAAFVIESPVEDARFGSALVGVPDANGDGAPDLLVGAPGAGRAFLVSSLDGAVIRSLEGDGGETFGITVATRESEGGAPLHAVGAFFRDGAGNLREREWLFDGGTGELLSRAGDDESPIVLLAGDLDGDGVVNDEDLARLLRALGRVAPGGGIFDPAADLTGDGVVDEADLNLLLANFGAEGGGDAGQPLLEPCILCPNGECFTPLNDCSPKGGGDLDEPPLDGTGGGGGGGGSGGGGGGGGDPPPPPPDPEEPPDECSVSIDGNPLAVLVFAPNDNDADDTNDFDDLLRLTASGSPAGGGYAWTIVASGPAPGALEFMDPATGQPTPAPTGPTVHLMGTEPSSARNDVSVMVTYTTADEACSATATVSFTVISVQVLSGIGGQASSLQIGHFGADRAPNELTGYTPAPEHALLNGEAGTFIDGDPDRFWIAVADARANADAGALETLAARVETLHASGAVDDAGAEMDLLESGLLPPWFVSEPMLLTSPDLPDNPDDDIAVWSARAGAAVPDDDRNDRTRRATVDGWVRVVYEAEGETFTKRVPVSNRNPAPPQAGQPRQGRQTLKIRVRVHLEPYLDAGVDALPIDPGAQFVGLRAENGAVVHKIYTANELPVGAGDEWFTFVDIPPLNNKHDPGEPSERYLDFSVGVTPEDDAVELLYQGGDGLRNRDGDGWGQVATSQDVLEQITRANIAWAQAGIRVEMIEGPIIEQAPSNAGGETILNDGWFVYDFDQIAVIEDELVAILAVGENAAPDVLEVIFTGPIPGAFAIASMPNYHGGLPMQLQDNTYVFMGPNLDLRNRTLAHEIGHALTNQIDAAPVPYIYFPFGVGPPEGGDSVPWQYRRIRHDAEAQARTVRDPGCLLCVGNLLLRPVGNEEEAP